MKTGIMKLSDTKSFLRIPVIYGIHNTITNKWYIGSCLDMKSRFQKHRYYLRNNIHNSNKLQRSYNLHGEDAFDVQILRFLSEGDDRFGIEEGYIREYNSVDNGYNILETCKEVNHFELSVKAKENFQKHLGTLKKKVICINRFTGEIVNELDSITDAAAYYKTSSSNISRVCKGILRYMKDIVFVYKEDFNDTRDYRAEHHAKGSKFTEEHKQKMRENHAKSKKVYKYDLENNLIEKYISRAEAERSNNFRKEYLRRRMDTPIGNYVFSYKNKDIV